MRKSCLQQSDKNMSKENAKSLKGSIEGKLYENISLALLAKRGYELSEQENSQFRDFSVGREVGIGKDGKFDDVVFSYKDEKDKNNLIFVQIKHKQDNHQINSEILSNKLTSGRNDGNMCRDFNLQKYFISYVNAKEELKLINGQKEENVGTGREKDVKKVNIPEELRNGEIKYVVIFTDVDLNSEELNTKGFNLKPAPDDITNLFTLRSSSLTIQSKHCYQLGNVSDDLSKTFKKSSHLHGLARALAQYVVWKNYRENKIMGIDESPIKHYHVALGKQVIKKSDQVTSISSKQKSKKYCEAQFRDDFLDNDRAGSKKELRDAIFEAIRELDESKLNTSDDVLKSILKEAKWKVVPNFGETKKKVERDLPSKWLTIEDKDITDFLECLVFVVNQPSVKVFDLLFNISTQDTVLENTSFRQILNKIENSGPEFRKHTEKLFGIFEKANYKAKWTSRAKIKMFFEEQKNFIRITFFVTALTVIYESETMQYGKFNNYGILSKKLDSFLLNESKILSVNTLATSLTSIKILQYLNTKEKYRIEDGRISISLSKLILKSKENRDCIIKAFQSNNNNLLVIECRHTVNDKNLEELYCKLSHIIKENDKKKIIFITQHCERAVLAEKFRMEFQNKGLYVLENDDICLKDFEPKEDPLMKNVFVFQNQEEKLSLAQLTGINSWNSYVRCVSQEKFCKKLMDLMDITTLDEILSNEEIKIGSKPLGTSSLEGAYATLFEEINAETFANKLSLQALDKNTNDIYIISGINGENQKEKVYKLITYLGLVNEQGIIENQLGEIGTDSQIQMADDLFKNENFKIVCRNYPEKQIFWISVKNRESRIKFILESFYNPKFYMKRKFKNVIIKKEIIKEQLVDKHLSKIFIFYCANNQKELIELFENKFEKEQFEINCKNGWIKLFTVEADAKATFQEIREQNQNQVTHLLKFEKKQFIWCNSHGSVSNLQTYVDKTNISLAEEDDLLDKAKDMKLIVIPNDMRIIKDTILETLCETKHESTYTNDQKELIESLFPNKFKKQQFENYWKNGCIKIFNLKADAKAFFREICDENESNVSHLLKFKKKVCYNYVSSRDELWKSIEEANISLSDEDSLFKEIQDRKAVIIADDPGMGKTTTLTKLCETKDESISVLKTHWIFRISLREHIQAIKDMEIKNEIIEIVNFLSKIDSHLNHKIAKNLLLFALDKSNNFSKPLLLAFDGFDEVLDEDDRNKIISLLKYLKNETSAKLWITTRLHFKEILENALETFAIEFHPMDYEAKVKFIRKYLKDRLRLILNEELFAELFLKCDEMQENKRMQKYTEAFLIKMESIFRDNLFKFIGTPLQLYLMLEGSISNFKNWIENKENQNLNFDYLGNDILDIYKKFIGRKYDIYFKKIDIKDKSRQKQEKCYLNQYNKNLVKSLILNSKLKKNLTKFQDIHLLVGVIKSQGCILEFIHTTFGDYFAAKLFIHGIKNMPNELLDSNEQECFLKMILMKPDYQLIRTFINLKLEKIAEPELVEFLKQFGKIIDKLLNEEQNLLNDVDGSVLHVAVAERNTNIAYFLINSLKEHRDSLKRFFFIRGQYGNTVLLLACQRSNFEIVRVLLDAAAEISEDTLQEVLDAVNDEGMNAFDNAVRCTTNIMIMRELLNRAENKINLIMNEKKKYSSLSIACRLGISKTVKFIFQEFEHDENFVKQLLLYIDRDSNPLYRTKCSPVFDYLLPETFWMDINERKFKKFDLPKNGNLPLKEALSFGMNDVVEILFNVAKSINDDNHTLKQLLSNDIVQESALSWAISYNTIFENVLSVASSMQDNETIKKLLLPGKGIPPLNAAILRNPEVVKNLLDFAKKNINDDNYTLKQMLLNDERHCSALCDAAKVGHCEIIKLLLETAAGLDYGMMDKLIFAIDKNGENAIQLMVKKGHENIFTDSFKILEEGKYKVVKKKVKEVFENSKFAYHLASKKRNADQMTYIYIVNDELYFIDDIF